LTEEFLFRTATGKELFDLDLPHLKDRIKDPRVAKKLYSYMGGFTASKFVKVMIGVAALIGIPLAIGANLYMVYSLYMYSTCTLHSHPIAGCAQL
jgi:hypothetical protein